jgi:hypothetical protein
MMHDAESWLFLPAVEHGIPKSKKVSLPLKL